MTKAKITVGVLEDDDVMRDYIQHVLSSDNDFELVFSVPTIRQALDEIEAERIPDICLVDLQLPDGIGTEFVEKLSKTTESKALILTVLGDRVSVMAGVESGAQGYLLKDSAPEMILQHIRDALKGANPMSAQATTHLLSMVKEHQARKVPVQKSILTERETEILTLFAKGMSYGETAEMLSISSHTVRDYVKSIYRKLDVNSKNEAVFEAVQMGWIDF